MDDECLQWWWQKAKWLWKWFWNIESGAKFFLIFGLGLIFWGMARAGGTDLPGGAALMQAGAAFMAFSAMVAMPVVMAKQTRQQRNDLALRRSILIAKGFFSDFDGVGVDRKLAFPALYDASEGIPSDILERNKLEQNEQLNKGCHQFTSARNWQFYQDAFQQLTGAQVDDMQLNSMLTRLSCAAYAMNAGYRALKFLDGNKVEDIRPFWQAYSQYKASVAGVRATYDALSRIVEKRHPSPSQREPNSASESPLAS